MSRNILFLGAALALGACAQPLAPTLNSSDETTWNNQIASLGALGTGAAMPTTSSATYSGLVGASLSDVGTLLAEIELTADFANDGISGAIQNANILNSSEIEDQALGGSIDLAGSIDAPNKTMSASGSGTLTAVGKVNGFGVKVNLNMDVDVDGTFRTSNGTDMDTITGTVDISGTASGPFGTDGGDFSGSGAEFYAQEQ